MKDSKILALIGLVIIVGTIILSWVWLSWKFILVMLLFELAGKISKMASKLRKKEADKAHGCNH